MPRVPIAAAARIEDARSFLVFVMAATFDGAAVRFPGMIWVTTANMGSFWQCRAAVHEFSV